MNGTTRATSLAASTVVASTSVTTPAVLTPTTGSHNMLALAYGSAGSGGNTFGSTDNYTIVHTAGTGTYQVRFTAASGLSAADFSSAVINLTLYGTSTGFASYSTNTPGIIDIYTTNASFQATERGFSFTVYRP